MLEIFLQPEAWVTLVTLSVLEIVLGIDNILFISILASKLPPEKQSFGRKVGLMGALVSRVLFLITVAWIAGMVEPVFSAFGIDFSIRDLVLIAGGAFLIYKAVKELYAEIEHPEGHAASASADAKRPQMGMATYVAQIMIIDIVFSIDSVITAVGLSTQVPIMVAAILIAVGVMILFSDPVGRFVTTNVSIKILALAFLVAVGLVLVIDGFHVHLSKNYLYVAMAFSFLLEWLNMRRRKNLNKRGVSA